MIMREEYQDQDQVQNLHSLWKNTEDRVRQMECDSEFAQGVANRLYAEGTEMQMSMLQSIEGFKQQSNFETSHR